MSNDFSLIAAKKAKGQQGKVSEKKVAEYLAAIDANVTHFDWNRGYDARAAGGKFQRVAGDFAFYSPVGHGIIEVKEVDHEFRLPYKNFELSQVAKAAKRELAGGDVHVLVYHTPLKRWRRLPIVFFQHRTGTEYSSWDLSEWVLHPSCAAALDIHMRKHTA